MCARGWCVCVLRARVWCCGAGARFPTGARALPEAPCWQAGALDVSLHPLWEEVLRSSGWSERRRVRARARCGRLTYDTSSAAGERPAVWGRAG